MGKKKSKTFLPSVGNDKADAIIAIAVVGGIAFGTYKIFKLVFNDANAQDAENLFENPVGALPPPTGAINVIEQKAIAKLMDDIYSAVIGANFFYDPERINRLLAYDCATLSWANTYYSNTYGERLYDALAGEWDFWYYNEAKAKLKSCGLD